MSEADIASGDLQAPQVDAAPDVAPADAAATEARPQDADVKASESPSPDGASGEGSASPDAGGEPKKKKLREIVEMSGGAVKCVECETRSYPAETIYFDKLPYHRECFKCTNCKEKIPTLTSANQYDQDLYCTRCYNNLGLRQKQLAQSTKWVPKATPAAGGSAAPARFGGGGTPCTACSKTCYPAEAVTFEKRVYHKDCLICSDCKTKCTLINVNQFEDNLFCTPCWDRGGYSRKQVEKRQQASAGASGTFNPAAARFGGGGVPCTVCSKTVYPAESLTFQSNVYHDKCLVCTTCSTTCNLTNVNQFEGKLYCTGCWDKGGFVMKQRDTRSAAAGQGAAANTSPSAASTAAASRFGGGGVPCTSCAKTVYPAESVAFQSQIYHDKCLVCTTCSTGCTVNNINQFEGKLYCSGCWEKGGFAAKQRDAKSAAGGGAKAGVANPNASRYGGGGIKCTTCDKTCYPAETVIFDKLPYHKDCLACSECSAKCTLVTANKFDGKILCKQCWDRGNYAMKQTQIKWEKKEDAPAATGGSAKFATLGGGGTKCTNCNKTVYSAEQVVYETLPYHKQCFTCTNCATKLEAVSAQHKDKKPYCGKCFQDLGLWRADA